MQINAPSGVSSGMNGAAASGSSGGGSGKDVEQQVSAEHEALAAKLNELGGLVAKFGVSLPQVLQGSLSAELLVATSHSM